MKKDDWVKIFVTGIIGWLTVVGGGGWYFMVFDKLFLAYWLGVPVLLFVIMIICIKYFSESEIPKIKVLDVKSSKNYFTLHVKNVGAEGEVTATVVDKSEFKVRWFKTIDEIKEVGGEKEVDLKRWCESYVIIRRRAVIGAGQRMSDFGLHAITLRFHETNQEFKYAFRITEEGIEDLEFLGEKDE